MGGETWNTDRPTKQQTDRPTNQPTDRGHAEVSLPIIYKKDNIQRVGSMNSRHLVPFPEGAVVYPGTIYLKEFEIANIRILKCTLVFSCCT